MLKEWRMVLIDCVGVRGAVGSGRKQTGSPGQGSEELAGECKQEMACLGWATA